MIGILLIYFIWKHYSELAVAHNKSKWGYGILGVATYYLGTAFGGVAIAIFDEIAGTGYLEELNNVILNLIAFPFGVLFVWGLFKFLEYKWANQKSLDDETLDQDFIE